MLVPCGRTCVTRHDMTWDAQHEMTGHGHGHDMSMSMSMSCHGMRCHGMSCMSWHDMAWCHGMSCISCHACHVVHVMSCHVMSMSCRCPCHVMLCMSCHVMSCHAIEFSTLQSSWQWNSRQMHASVLILYKVQVPQCGSRIFPCVFAHCTCPDRVKT